GSFADAAFPNAQFNQISLRHAHKDNIRTIGKLRMDLDHFSELPPVQLVKVLDENTAVGISHLHCSDGHRLAIYRQRITDYFVERRPDRHRYGLAVELWLPQFSLE